MAIFKCKMCGGTIEFEQGATVGVCDSCGTKQTLPKTNDEAIKNLFNRATNLRLKCEFDKAEQIYEKIVQQDDSEAEAHWGIVLCKYGIEYVEDPKTFTRIPTCHRTLFEAVTTDPDYIAAIDYSDASQQAIYEAESRAIDKIQKDILAIVKNEKPFDVFICYKETGEDGKRTIDSTIANDIYYQLTQEGFKVFYAAITLEDKLGKEYEPYIFAALNSSKVMLVLGTKPEYFSAVWVKNEWSRFMNFMKTDRSKLLIPCYRDMDAYDLPEEFAHLQAQDMSKIGFINDVVRGIKKVVNKEEAQETVKETVVVNNTASSNTEPLLKRAFMFLEDGEWEKADDFCEQVLNINPEEPRAYLGKLMAETKVNDKENFRNLKEPFDNSGSYRKLLRFCDNVLKEKLTKDNEFIKNRNEEARKQEIYNNAKQLIKDDIQSLKDAIEMFCLITGWKDVDAQIDKCQKTIEKIEELISKKPECAIRVLKKKVAIENDKKIQARIDGYKTEEQYLEAIYASFDENKKLIQEKEIKQAEINQGITELTEKKDSLGIFASKERKEIGKEIEEKKNEVEDILKEKALLERRLGGYTEKEKVEIQINITKDKIIQLEELKSCKLEDVDKLMTYEEAWELYKHNNKVREEIKKIIKMSGTIFKQGEKILLGESFGKMLEWVPVEKKENSLLVVSKEAICEKTFENVTAHSKWEKSSLREWLNKTFFEETFSDFEKELIEKTKLECEENPSYETRGGESTGDRLFVLSISEASKLSKDKRACKMPKSDKPCSWWLRSPGNDYNKIACVDEEGKINCFGHTTTEWSMGVRPAMWISVG